MPEAQPAWRSRRSISSQVWLNVSPPAPPRPIVRWVSAWCDPAEGSTGHDLAVGVAHDLVDDEEVGPAFHERDRQGHDEQDAWFGLG